MSKGNRNRAKTNNEAYTDDRTTSEIIETMIETFFGTSDSEDGSPFQHLDSVFTKFVASYLQLTIWLNDYFGDAANNPENLQEYCLDGINAIVADNLRELEEAVNFISGLFNVSTDNYLGEIFPPEKKYLEAFSTLFQHIEESTN